MAAVELIETPQEEEQQGERLALHLPTFEGPLDLLLDLIRKHDIDIFDIPIKLVTDEFLRYVEAAEDVDLELSAEWLEMAAMLVYIKSKMLLPKDTVIDEEEDGPDPRAALVLRILEYQKFKQAAESLFDRPQLERDVFVHPSRAGEYQQMAGPARLRDGNAGDLMKAVQRIIARGNDRGEWIYDLSSQQLTLRSVILDISNILQSTPRVHFEDLFEGFEFTKHRVITTFLALLEMTRLKMVKLFQSQLEDEPTLYVERSVIDILEVTQELELGEAFEYQDT